MGEQLEKVRQRGDKGEGTLSPYGEGRWRARITLKGVTKQKVVNSRKEGNEQLREWIAQHKAGALNRSSKMTVIALMEAWVVAPDAASKAGRQLSMTTRQGYTEKMDAYIRWASIATIRIDELTASDISKFITSLADGTFAEAKTAAIQKQVKALKKTDPDTVWRKKELEAKLPELNRVIGGRYSASIQRQCYANIRNALIWACHPDKKYLSYNVARDAAAPTAQTNAARDSAKVKDRAETLHGYHIDHDTLMLIFVRISKEQRLRARWLLALDMGLRPGECLGLTWGDIGWTKKSILVQRQVQHSKEAGKTAIVWDVKTDSGDREVPLPEYILQELRDWKTVQDQEKKQPGWTQYVSPDGVELDLIFTQRNGNVISHRLDAMWWRRMLTRKIEHVEKVRPVRRYVARHVAATRMVAIPDADLMSVSGILGHSDPAFTLRTYSKALEEKRVATVNILHETNVHRVQNYMQGVIDAQRNPPELTEMQKAGIEYRTQEVDEQAAGLEHTFNEVLRRKKREKAS